MASPRQLVQRDEAVVILVQSLESGGVSRPLVARYLAVAVLIQSLNQPFSATTQPLGSVTDCPWGFIAADEPIVILIDPVKCLMPLLPLVSGYLTVAILVGALK